MNQKGTTNIVLIIVVIVILAGVLGYFAFFKKAETVTQQPSPTQLNNPTKTPADETPTPPIGETSSWKTYTNTAYGFEVKYPKEWQGVDENGCGENCIGFNSGHDQDWVANILVSSKAYPDVKQDIIKQINPKIKLDISEKKVVLNSISWTELIIKEVGGNVIIDAFFTERNGKTFRAQMTAEMLSTFRFIR